MTHLPAKGQAGRLAPWGRCGHDRQAAYAGISRNLGVSILPDWPPGLHELPAAGWAAIGFDFPCRARGAILDFPRGAFGDALKRGNRAWPK